MSLAGTGSSELSNTKSDTGKLSHISTLVELLRYRALNEPERLAYTFLLNGEQPLKSITYGELDRQARTIAVWLTNHNTYKRRAILIQKAGLDFLKTYLGCLYAGIEAIALVPPHLSQTHSSMEMFKGVIAKSETQFLFADPLILHQRERVASEFGVTGLKWVNLEQVLEDENAAGSWRDPAITAKDISHLQYTSGSTSHPKGVKVTHGNVISNLNGLGYVYSRDSLTVNWLPHYHDMGLINGLLQPLYSGFHSFFMSPFAFMQKPLRWLQAISTYKATHLTAPNFAFELCLRRIRPGEISQLDLSCLEVAFSGAEPVRWETMLQFGRTFRQAGFRFETFQPAYGLAEATLGVSTKLKSTPPRYLNLDARALQSNRVNIVADDHPDSQKVVACGPLYPDTRVVIVNPLNLNRTAPDEVGEIWLQGPGVALGYFGQPELTTQTFEAHLADGEGPFLRTGDLGFVQEGELFISGRSKDLIIIRGRNHWPQDLERTTEECLTEIFKSNGSAAFSVELNSEERLIIAAEIRPGAPEFEFEQVEDRVRRDMAERYDLNLYELVLLKQNGLPRTTSGKVQRQATRAAWLNKNLEGYFE